MWVRFTSDFDFSPAEHCGRVTIAYKAGMLENVTRACATAAEKADAGSRSRPVKEVADGDADRSR